jgi:sulfur-oxidizing protein SoxY
VGIICRGIIFAMLALGALVGSSRLSFAQDDNEAQRAERWKELQHAIFADRSIKDGSGLIEMDAPVRALDAALVPISVTLKGQAQIRSLFLVIDENPGPLAGHFTFGPQSDPRALKLRVRVNAYTNIHAVIETRDNQLYAVARFVKASGGCSAPAGADENEALKDIGHMKLHLLQPFSAGQPIEAQLMIRHPNFNGMQMNQVTRLVTPPRFIRTIDVTYDGTEVLHLDSDISLSTDPVITFGFVPQQKGRLQVVVRDTSDASFSDSFDVPAPAG